MRCHLSRVVVPLLESEILMSSQNQAEEFRAARIGKVTEWIDIIHGEIQDLFLHHYIFWELQKIIENNEKLSTAHNHFFVWIGNSFVYSSSMFVRRQTDSRRDAISFRKLLEELCRPPHLITREDFVNRGAFRGARHLNRVKVPSLEREFDEIAGEGAPYLQRAQIRADIGTLMESARSIEDYANHHIAHYAARPYDFALPTFADLDKCMKVLEELLQKYYFLIKGTRVQDIDVESTFMYDWKEIFAFPWLKDEKERRTEQPSAPNSQ